MKRRTFLTIAGIGGVVAGVGGLVLGTTSLEDAVSRKIHGELSFLTLDKEGVRRFIADYTKSMTSSEKRSLKLYAFFGISSRQSQKINRLLNAYLLSSDFFINGMNEDRTISYAQLYLPEVLPCINPFTSAHYSENVAVSEK